MHSHLQHFSFLNCITLLSSLILHLWVGTGTETGPSATLICPGFTLFSLPLFPSPEGSREWARYIFRITQNASISFHQNLKTVVAENVPASSLRELSSKEVLGFP